jgi:hypothetical protein
MTLGIFTPTRTESGSKRRMGGPRIAAAHEVDHIVAGYLADEWQMRDIAARMGISLCRVEASFKRIRKRLGVQAV